MVENQIEYLFPDIHHGPLFCPKHGPSFPSGLVVRGFHFGLQCLDLIHAPVPFVIAQRAYFRLPIDCVHAPEDIAQTRGALAADVVRLDADFVDIVHYGPPPTAPRRQTDWLRCGRRGRHRRVAMLPFPAEAAGQLFALLPADAHNRRQATGGSDGGDAGAGSRSVARP